MYFKILLLASFFVFTSCATTSSQSRKWPGLDRGKIDLKLPLLTIKGPKGFLACGYVSSDVCNKTGEACAIISGVMTHEDMLMKKIKAVSDKGKALGLKIGMTGLEAISIIK